MLYLIHFKEGEDECMRSEPHLLRWVDFSMLKFYVGHQWGQECNLNCKFLLCIGEELLDWIV